MKQGIVVLTMLTTLTGTANAVITFTEFPVGTVISNQYAGQGVLFLPGNETPRLPQIAIDEATTTSPVLRPTGEPDFEAFQGDFWMQFTVPAMSVAFDSGYWNFLGSCVVRAYDPALGLVTSLSNTTTGVYTFAISGVGPIGYVYFNSVADFMGAAIDNLTFTQFAVPAPGAVLLGALGAGLIGWMRRRTAP